MARPLRMNAKVWASEDRWTFNFVLAVLFLSICHRATLAYSIDVISVLPFNLHSFYLWPALNSLAGQNDAGSAASVDIFWNEK